MTGQTSSDPLAPPPTGTLQKEVIRLLVIPLLLFIIWFMEIFLLERGPGLFREPGFVPLLFYTLAGCILTGIVASVLLIRRSFLFGAVNMFQIGFRSPKRTLLFCTLTGAACTLVVILTTTAGPDRTAVSDTFLVYLPTAIAAVMVCWMLIGTHLQALVRAGGAVVSIPTGVVITAILFSLTSLAHTPPATMQSPLDRSILLGIVIALFFFAARDVYATALVAATGMALLFPLHPGAAFLPGITLSAVLAVGALLGVHAYFSLNYATVIVVPDR